ncbi:MAG TPA: class I SAM-dependent methyltransferase [Solirubrobacterales bacterium]|nr:class I SAM-dependent methyltransferase [Solirubrobacterales bacterium]
MPSPPLTPLAVALLQIPAPERALVIGSGNGDAALYLAREFPSARIRGVDRSPARVREASTRVGLDPEGRIAFKASEGKALPYPDEFFDLVVLLDRHAGAAEIARVMRPGAHLVTIDPGEQVGALAGARAKLARRLLARRGIEPVTIASAGDGNFFVARRREED